MKQNNLVDVHGLRNMTQGEIKELKEKYRNLGYSVKHQTHGNGASLPFNGVLKVYRK